MRDRRSALLAGIIFAALSIAAAWCYAESAGWMPWLRIPALILAIVCGLIGLRALSRAAAWPN
jgi:hypothetical protein